jgi:hypothetical protein
VFAPFNKQAMHLGGSPFPDELHFMADRLQWKGHVSAINMQDDLWTSRVTSHVGLRQVSALITRQGVHDAIALIDGVLRGSGVKAPRLAVAALNPHGGEGGLPDGEAPGSSAHGRGDGDRLMILYLTNLDQIRVPRCRFAALPLPVQGADGSPVRAVAIVE